MPTRKWSVQYASGSTATVVAEDYAAALERAKQLAPKLKITSICLIGD